MKQPKNQSKPSTYPTRGKVRATSRKPSKRTTSRKRWHKRTGQAYRATDDPQRQSHTGPNRATGTTVPRQCERVHHGAKKPGTGSPPRRRKATIHHDENGNLTNTGATQIANLARSATPVLNNRGKRRSGYFRDGATGCGQGDTRASLPNVGPMTDDIRRTVDESKNNCNHPRLTE
jgi:hypothetical protein